MRSLNELGLIHFNVCAGLPQRKKKTNTEDADTSAVSQANDSREVQALLMKFGIYGVTTGAAAATETAGSGVA